MGNAPPLRPVVVIALLLAVGLPVAAHIDGPSPNAVEGSTVKTSAGGNPYATGDLDVYVRTGNLTGPLQTYLKDVDAALAYWEQVDDPRVSWLDSLDRTAAPGQAEIVLELHDVGHLLLEGRGDEARSLGLGTPGNATTEGQVDLTTRVGCTTIFRSHDQVEELATHEIGHALGLRHTEDPDDPMHHGGAFHGMPNPLDLAFDSPNTVTGRVAGLTAPFSAPASCSLLR